MAIELAQGYVSVTPSAKGFGAKLRDETEGPSRQAGDAAGESFSGAFGGSLKKLAAVATAAFAGLKIGEFLKGSFDAASDLSESASKVGVVFGDSAGEIQDWAKTSATAMGQSRQQALEAAGTFGNLFTAMKIGQPQAADMSKTLVGLAGDLASFNNVSPEEALEALRSGLTGETEPLKRFGVNMNEATLKAKAMELGLSDGKGVLDANAKAQAAYALILEQTGTAQGDFARTSSGLANQQRILAAQWTNLKATIGNAFLPLLVNSGHVLTTIVLPALQRFAELAGPAVTKALQNFKASVNDAIKDVRAGFTDGLDLAGPFDNLGRLLRNGVEAVKLFADAFKNGIDIPGDPFDNLGRAARNAVEAVKLVVDAFKNGIDVPGDPFDNVGRALRNIVEFLKYDLPEGIRFAVAGFMSGRDDIAGSGFIGTMDDIGAKLRAVSDWFREHKDILTVFAASATAGVVGLLAYSGAAGGIAQALTAIKAAQATLSSAGGLASLLGPLGQVAAAAGPWGILAAAIAAVIAAVVALYFKWQPFHDFVNTAAATVRDVAVAAFNALASAFGTVASAVSTAFAAVQNVISTAVAAILVVLQPLIDWVTVHLFPALASMVVFVAASWQRAYQIIADIVSLIIAVVGPFVQHLIDVIQIGFTLIAGLVEQAMNLIQTVIQSALSVLVPLWQTGWNAMLVVVQTVAALIINGINVALNTIRGIFSALTALIRGDWSGFWEALRSIATGILSGIAAAISAALSGIAGLFSAILGGIPGIVSGIGSGIRSAFDGIIGALQSAASTIEGLVSRVRSAIASIPGTGAISGLLSKIPGLAAGGLVTRPTLAVVGEAGPEAVIPLDMFNQGVQFSRYPTFTAATIPDTGRSYGSPSVTVNAQTNADPHQIARELSWVLRTRGR